MIIKVMVFMKNEAFRNVFIDLLGKCHKIDKELKIEAITCKHRSEIAGLYVSERPAILITDINRYPSGYEYDIISDILRLDNTAKIIGVTSHYQEDVSLSLTKAGALGYFHRNAAPNDMLTVLLNVYKYKSFDSQDLHETVGVTNHYDLTMARKFIGKLLNGNQSENEHKAFLHWLKKASIEELGVIADEHEIWLCENGNHAMVGPSVEWIQGLEEKLDRVDEISMKDKRIYSMKWMKMRMKAAVLLFGLISSGVYLTWHQSGLVFFGKKQSNEVVYHDLSTGPGQRKQWVLPDGSLVWLNAASTLRYSSNMPNKDRTVELTGEAFFEVTHHEGTAFRVKVKDMEVQVLGTRFDVRSYQEQNCSKVTLAEGAVKITRLDEEAILGPSDQAQVVDSIMNGHSIKIIRGVDGEMPWKNGYLEFRNDDLPIVLQELARSYNFKVQVDGQLPGEKFTGSFSLKESIEEVAQRLNSQNINVSIRIKKDKTIVLMVKP